MIDIVEVIGRRMTMRDTEHITIRVKRLCMTDSAYGVTLVILSRYFRAIDRVLKLFSSGNFIHLFENKIAVRTSDARKQK